MRNPLHILALAFTLALVLASSLSLRADYNFKFCGSLYTAYGISFGNNQQLRLSMDIPGDMATQLAGNKITQICYGMGAEKTTSVPVTVFVMEEGQYVSTGFDDNALENATGTVSAIGILDTPYTIKENTPFSFGFIMEKPISGIYPVGLSNSGPALFSGKLDILEDGLVVGDIPNIAESTGGLTSFLYAVSVGEKDALLNYVLLEEAGTLLPTVEQGQTLTSSIKVTNISSRYISTLKFDIKIGDSKTQYEYTRRLSAGASKTLTFPTPAVPHGRNSLKVTVVDTDGTTPASTATYSTPVMGLAPGEGFKQMMVVEEATGTWCGYCPAGIVGMDYMSQAYRDDFIGICVHGGQDPFVIDSYAGLDRYVANYPSSIANRQPVYAVYPDQNRLETAYKDISKGNAAAQISLTVVQGDNELYAVSSTDFAFNHFCQDGYKVAFVIIENGLVGAQTNYYSGQSGSLEWWDNQRSTVVWTYSDTARDIFDFDGLEGSLIDQEVTTEPYNFQATLPLSNVKDVDNTAVIALLLDDETGVIINACRVYADDYKTVEETGVTNVALEHKVITTAYYTLSGQKVENPQSGQLYLEILSNGKVLKRVFK